MRSTEFVVARNDLQQCKFVDTECPDAAALRDAYVEFLSRRLDEPREWVRDLEVVRGQAV